jgi:Transglutaminase-like superfamily
MLLLTLAAFWQLVRFDLCLSRRGFAAAHKKIRDCEAGGQTEVTAESICSAVDLASIWYWKQVPCLQRSLATVWLLRLHGIPATLVIGAQQIPFRAHAWVEVMGRIVNDKPYVPEMYAVLEKC